MQDFSSKLFELLGEQAEKKCRPMPLPYWCARDFVHFIFDKESAERLTLHILKNMQTDYDFKRN